MKPLFIYPIQTTSWHVIVNLDASHFYFDKELNRSVWQLCETGLDLKVFSQGVNFDELALLFGKARGLKVKTRKEVPKSDEKDDKDYVVAEKSEDLEDSVEFEDSDEDEQEAGLNEDTMDLLKSVMAEYDVEIEQESASEEYSDGAEENKAENQKSTGLTLGYSSLEESEEENENETGNEVEETSATYNKVTDIDQTPSESDTQSAYAGEDGETQSPDLDLSVGETAVSEEDKLAFKRLLDDHKDEISMYDPWFVVEEEILPKVAASAAYYGITDENMREQIFNEWVEEQNNAKESGKQNILHKYPTNILLFFKFLQDYKAEVRKLYYSEFCNKHQTEISEIVADLKITNAESLYRQLRVTLVDFGQYEKANKGKSSGNFKVSHVQRFLSQHEYVRARRSGEERRIERKTERKTERKAETSLKKDENCRVTQDSECSHFDEWMRLLNSHGVPESLAHSTENFILGDEKRLQCYKQVFNNAD